MSWLSNWLSTRPRAARPIGQARKASLQLEALEHRDVPAVVFNGGDVMPNVQVQGIYLGADWASDPTLTAQQRQLEDFLHTAVGPYVEMLKQAGYATTPDGTIALGKGSAAAGVNDKNPFGPAGLGTTVSDAQIVQELKDQITNGQVLKPGTTPDHLYVLYLPPGVKVTGNLGSSDANFTGYHAGFQMPDGSYVNYAVIPYPGDPAARPSNVLSDFNLTPLQNMTRVTSHELVEAVTDAFGPNHAQTGKQGWIDTSGTAPENEIADMAEKRLGSRATAYLNGYAVEKVEATNGNFVAPAGAFEGMLPSGPALARAVNGETFGIFGADGHLEELTGGSWQTLAPPPGEANIRVMAVSAGNKVLDAVFADGSLWQYRVDQGTWGPSAVALPPDANQAGIAALTVSPTDQTLASMNQNGAVTGHRDGELYWLPAPGDPVNPAGVWKDTGAFGLHSLNAGADGTLYSLANDRGQGGQAVLTRMSDGQAQGTLTLPGGLRDATALAAGPDALHAYFAVIGPQQQLQMFDGTSWKAVSTPGTAGVASIRMESGGSLDAVFTDGTAGRYNVAAGTWDVLAMPPGESLRMF
jgi:hypothetical protein